MPKQFYFENEDADRCYLEEHFQQQMQDEGLTEITVLEAHKSTEKEYIYCACIGECGESSECGKECDCYEPRNGKNGCCRHRRTLYEHGKEVTLYLKPNRKKNGHN